MKTTPGFLRPCAATAAVTAVLAAVVGLIASGPAAAAWAAAGVAAVSLGFVGSVWAVAKAERIDIRLTLAVSLITYAVKFIAFGAALWAVSALYEPYVVPLALGIGTGAVTWVCAQGFWLYRARVPYVELDGDN